MQPPKKNCASAHYSNYQRKKCSRPGAGANRAIIAGQHFHCWLQHRVCCTGRNALPCQCKLEWKKPREGYEEKFAWFFNWMIQERLEPWGRAEVPVSNKFARANIDLVLKRGNDVHVIEIKTGYTGIFKPKPHPDDLVSKSEHRKQVSMGALLYNEVRPHKMRAVVAHVVYVDSKRVETLGPSDWNRFQRYVKEPVK